MLDLELINQKAKELGFDAIGFTSEFKPTHKPYFIDWLDKGKNAEMSWLSQNREITLHPKKLMDDTRSVIVLATSYCHHKEQGDGYKIARYACGEDYHIWIKQRLERLARFIKSDVDKGFKWRCFVDTGPVLERDLAAKAGLGWIGKNTCLINKKLGSYVFLSVIFCNLSVSYRQDVKDLCRVCELCIKACPTKALEPYKLDASRCLAYHNIEKRGERDRKYWPYFKDCLVGCDICQEVCPRNIKVSETKNKKWLSGFEDCFKQDFVFYLNLKEGEYKKRFKKSAIGRIKYLDFMRNVFLVIAGQNRKDLMNEVLLWKEKNKGLKLAELDYCIKRLKKAVL